MKSSAASLVALPIGGVLGWLLCSILGSPSANPPSPRHNLRTSNTPGHQANANHGSTGCATIATDSVVHEVRICGRKLEDLESELSTARADLENCLGDRIAWPTNISSKWSEPEFRDRIVAILDKMGVDGDVAFFCEEFPCLAQLPDSMDWKRFRELAEADFGAPDVASVVVRSHALVGEYGHRELRFVSAGPADYVDDFAADRLDDRIADLVQIAKRELKQSAPG